MPVHTISYTPEAEAQLVDLYRYIATEASPTTAERFTGAIVDRCEALSAFPDRGAPRFDVRPGLRTLPFRRVTITYSVKDMEVIIIGIFYGGQDYESILPE
jgi:toxin ParE1/3/4